MKRLCFFLFLTLSFVLSGCDQNNIASLELSKQKIFTDALIMAKTHSRGIEFARDRGYFLGEGLNCEMIVRSFAREDRSLRNMSDEMIDYVLTHRSEPVVRTKALDSMCSDLFEEIIEVSNSFDRFTDFEKEVTNILMQPKYLNCDDEAFGKLALLAAIYIDSITYWNRNLEGIIRPIITKSEEVGGWDWEIFWYDLKEIAKADGKGALFGALLGPEGMLVTAVLESIERTEEVANEYYENKEQ